MKNALSGNTVTDTRANKPKGGSMITLILLFLALMFKMILLIPLLIIKMVILPFKILMAPVSAIGGK